MIQTRRAFLATGGAAAGAVTLLTYAAMAETHMSNTFQTDAGEIAVHPVSHASFVMETPKGVIYVDPVGGAEAYSDLPDPDLILITHEHGDHYDPETLSALMSDGVHLVTNPAVGDMLSEELAGMSEQIGNGESTEWYGLTIDAIPAYNTTEERQNFHPEGRDNGYVLGFEGFRVYISGDTEVTPAMEALEDIDLAFVCMNLPFTMSAEQAAEGVNAFNPTYVYPYHYRGRDGGTQDPKAFADLVESAEVLTPDWYPENDEL